MWGWYRLFQDSTISYLFWACYTPNCFVFTTKSIRMVDSGRRGTVVEVDQLFKVQLAQRLRPSGSFYNGDVIKRMALRGKNPDKNHWFWGPQTFEETIRNHQKWEIIPMKYLESWATAQVYKWKNCLCW